MMKICEREECQEPFEAKDVRKRYCSRSCAAIVNNTAYPKRKKVFTERECIGCNQKLQRHQEKFCSHACQHKYKNEKTVLAWLNGKHNGSEKNGGLSRWARKYLLAQAENRCQSPTCAVSGGWSVPNPVTGTVILTIDHIDGNWKNNTVDNLIVLCYSCHTLTPTFGSLNKKSAGIRGSGNRAYRDYSMDRKTRENASLV